MSTTKDGLTGMVVEHGVVLNGWLMPKIVDYAKLG